MIQEPMNREPIPPSGYDLPAPAPLPFGQAIRELPRQYIRVLTRPSPQTFEQEMGKASWSMVWVQLLGLSIIVVLLELVSSLVLAPTVSSIPGFKPLSPVALHTFALLSSLGQIIIQPLTFFIFMVIAYRIAKAFDGQGTFLTQCYIALLAQVPLDLLSQLLSLFYTAGFPTSSTSTAVSSTLIVGTALRCVFGLISVALIIYQIVLQVFGMMAVHRLRGGQATVAIVVPTVLMLVVNVGVSFLLFFMLGR